MDNYENRMAGDWIAAHRSEVVPDGAYDPLEYYELIVKASAAYGWSLIAATIRLDPTGDSLPLLAYGPLFSWVKLYGVDSEWITFLEHEASVDEKIKWTLGGVPKGSMPEEVWERLIAFRGKEWFWDGSEIPPFPERPI